jgi:hypothetical protein
MGMRLVVLVAVAAAAALSFGCDGSPDVPPLQPLDAYGGALALPLANSTGYFAVTHANGRWWFVTPEGHAFVSMGVNNVGPVGDTDRETGRDPYGDTVAASYASEAAWSDAAVERLQSWTFNTIGAWSRHDLFAGRLPQAPILGFGGSGWRIGAGPDCFDPAWEQSVQQSARDQIGGRAGDPYILGWFLDNELRWGPDWRGSDDLFDVFLALPASAPGKLALINFVSARFGGDIGGFNQAFGTSLPSFDALSSLSALATTTGDAATVRAEFAGVVATRYFAVTSAAVRAADPNHLVLGCRFVSWVTPPTVVDAAGPYLDVVSVNHYEIDAAGVSIVKNTPSLAGALPTDGWLAEFAHHSGRPLLISEFGARAVDSGLPNDYPPYFFQKIWDTQGQRADALERYGRALAEQPYLVGIHWFEWFDEPPGGRFDGEDSNWGLVSSADVPYDLVVERARRVGPLLTYWHHSTR